MKHRKKEQQTGLIIFKGVYLEIHLTLYDEEEEIAPVLEDLDIKTGPFDFEEYAKTKKSPVEGKICGEDGIPPEILIKM